MVSQPGSGPTRPKSPCYNNTLRQPPLGKSVKWTQSDKTQSDSPVNHSRECATIECYNKEQFINVPSNRAKVVQHLMQVLSTGAVPRGAHPSEISGPLVAPKKV